MIKYGTLIFCLLVCISTSKAQNVGIGTNNPEAKLDVVSTSSGMLIPRVALAGTTDVVSVPTATTSELIYNTATVSDVTPGFYFWNGTVWVRIKVGAEGEDKDWYESGLATAPDDINDDIYTNGSVSIGLPTPLERLHVSGNIRVDGDTIMTEDNIATQFVILSNGGVVIKLDNNDDGLGEEFSIKRSGPDANSKVFTVTEAGNTDADGWGIFGGRGEFNGNVTIRGNSRDLIVQDNFDIVGTSSVDIFLDSDADNPASSFAIKNDTGDELLAIAENQVLTLYPFGPNPGETGGLRLRELDANGGNYIEIQAADDLGSSYTFTWPRTDGGAGMVMSTDGSGILSWRNANTLLATDNATIDTNGTGNTLQVIGLPPGDGDYIQNQDAVEQSGARYRIQGDGTVSDFNVTGGDIYGPGINYGSNSILRFHSRTDFRFSLDDDDNGNESFQIHRNGSTSVSDRIFEVFEDGVVETDGSYGMLETGASPANYTYIQSGDLSGSDLTFTLPSDEGLAGDVLQTDGSGVLSWTTPGAASADDDWYDLAGATPDDIADDLYTLGYVGIGTATPDATYSMTVVADGETSDLVKLAGENLALYATVNSGAEDVITAEHTSTSASANIHAIQGTLTDKNNVTGILGYFRGTTNDLAYGVYSTGGDVGGYFENEVGIGALDPQQELHVEGNARITDLAGANDRLVLSNSDGDLLNLANGAADEILTSNGTNVLWQSADFINDHDWHAVDDGGQADDINEDIYTFGSVGIGLNTPTAPLQIEAFGTGNPGTNALLVRNSDALAGDRDAVITIQTAGDGDGDPFIAFDVAAENGWSVGVDNSQDNTFKIANDWGNLSNQTKMVIERSGEVGIGIQTPTQLLHLFFSGRNGILIDGDGLEDAFIQFENAGGSHYVFDDDSDGNALEIESANDFRISAGGGNNDHITVQADGDVGIGTRTQVEDLDVRGDNTDDGATFQVANSDASHFLKMYPGRQNETLPFIQWNDGDHLRFATDAAGFTEHVRIESDGDVGIGTTTPAARVDIVGGNLAMNDNEIRLRNGGDVNHFIKYVGGSIDGVQIQGNTHAVIRSATRDLAYFIDYNTSNNDWPGVYAGAAYAGGQTGGSFGEAVRLVRGRNGDGTLEFMNDGWGRVGGSNGLAFWANGNADGDDAPAMVLLSNGRLGIGTNAPRAAVEINATVGYQYCNYAYLANCAQGCNGGCSGTVPVSLLANGRIVASEFGATSDQRIKNIVGISDSRTDLQTLMKIEITDYRMKDQTVSNGNFKKIIAQQVEKYYPQAVSTVTEVIPDIYRLASIENGRIDLTNDLSVGDRVKVIFEDDHSEVFDVNKSDSKGFHIDSDKRGQVFVYGREVDDFRIVDYEAISMLNVSGTQELYRLLNEQKAKVERLEKENGELKANDALQNARLEAIEAKLGLGIQAGE